MRGGGGGAVKGRLPGSLEGGDRQDGIFRNPSLELLILAVTKAVFGATAHLVLQMVVPNGRGILSQTAIPCPVSLPRNRGIFLRSSPTLPFTLLMLTT